MTQTKQTAGNKMGVAHLLARSFQLVAIARKHLNLETLMTRRSDSLDFSDQSVGNIRAALYAALEAGRNSR